MPAGRALHLNSSVPISPFPQVYHLQSRLLRWRRLLQLVREQLGAMGLILKVFLDYDPEDIQSRSAEIEDGMQMDAPSREHYFEVGCVSKFENIHWNSF